MDIVLRDENGKMVNIATQFGKGRPVIITPVYYSCPMLCNITIDTLIGRMADLKKLDAGRDFEILTYSFDPVETSPEADAKRTLYLRRYGRQGAGQGWHFYTGDEKSVRKLSDALGFKYTYDPVKKQYAHAALIAVATPDGKISRYFYGMDYTPRDLNFGLIDASGGKIGAATDKLLMLCYDYNPATGKYSATAMNIVRVGGTASVLGLAGFIFISLRRERLAAKR
jgi:protein SCO1/2